MGKNRFDAHTYRKFLASQMKKSKESGDVRLGKREHLFQGNESITRTTTSEEVQPGVTENSLSCSKRQRADSDSIQHGFFGSNELGRDLPDAYLPNMVEQISAARRCLKGETEVGSLSGPTLVGEKHNGSKSPSHVMAITKEHANEACSEKRNSEAETGGEHNVCSICMLGGELWCCNGTGCGNNYHLSCLDPSFTSAPLGLWHCSWCVTKKIQFGVHSVSEVVESIWDVKDVITDNEAMLRQKQYLVKYRGLAHVHNRWIPEMQLLFDAPKHLSEFNPKNQAVRWKKWTVPQRLLRKKRILSRKQFDGYCQYDGDRSDCHYEWLVKWTGLGYDHATWELENAPFLTSPEAAKLIKDYESRHEKAEIPPNLLEVDEEGKGNFSEFSFGCSPGIYNQYLSYVKKLYEHWHKVGNAIIFDGQSIKERALKLILFISSLHLVVQRPFLIISTSSALSVWEAEFFRVVPSANVVVYIGNRAVRKSIRQLEFYNEGGRIMFEVLLSSWDVVVEDLEDLEYIGWEAVVIEQCQHSRILRHLNKFKMLAADKKILLDSDQIKYRSTDYLKMLLFLDYEREGQDCNDKEISSNTKIDKLKERLAPYVAYECQSSSTRFVEYWVPVRLSNVQLEQYCANLLSNSMLLSSCLKNNAADALREIVTSSKKCCDHPNLLDHSLPSKINLDTDIQASGKLQLLDKVLLEIKSQGLRVVILFQSIGGSGPFSVGDILEDFVHQRFGNCCVRIDDAESYNSKKKRIKKKEAMDTFNDKESGKFILLIENRACRPNVELSSVDTIIVFSSDWDPLNDIRALDKITIGSQFEKLNVFRLYSCCTIEEKVLILAKDGLTLDGGLKAMTRNTCHVLLRWGASYLFKKLDDFHRCCTSASSLNISSDQLFLDDVMRELSAHLPCSSENSDASNNSIITKVQQSGGVYGANMTLLGEKEVHGDGPPTSFWTNILLGRCPKWIFLSESSPRVRKNMNEVTPEYDSLTETNREVVSNTVYPVHLISGLYKRKKRTAASKDSKLRNEIHVSVHKRRAVDKAFYSRHLKPGWSSRKKKEVVNKKGPELDGDITPHSNISGAVVGQPDALPKTITIQIVSHKESSEKEASILKDARAASSEQHTEGLDQNAVKNIQINHSVPSEGHLDPLNEVVIINDPVMASAHARPSHEESNEDPVGNSTISNVQQSTRAVAPISGDSPICESTGTSSLLLQQNTSTSLGHSLPVNQLGSRKEQNGGRYGSSSESQSPREPCLENHLHHFSPLMVHSQQPSTDPLLMEMERIRKDLVQALKIHEDKILQLKFERDKEREEVEKKYDLLFRDAEEAVAREEKYLEMNHHKVYLQKLLAEALKQMHDNIDTAGSPDPLIQIHAQSALQRRPASLSTTSPVQRVNHPSELFSSSAGPRSSPMSFIQCAPLRSPHPQPYNLPRSSVAANHFPVLGNGERNLQSQQINAITELPQNISNADRSEAAGRTLGTTISSCQKVLPP